MSAADTTPSSTSGRSCQQCTQRGIRMCKHKTRRTCAKESSRSSLGQTEDNASDASANPASTQIDHAKLGRTFGGGGDSGVDTALADEESPKSMGRKTG
eukprot:3293883-Amphidinium_carterae.3